MLHPFTQFLLKEGYIKRDALYVLKDDLNASSHQKIYEILEKKKLLMPDKISEAFTAYYGIQSFKDPMLNLDCETLRSLWPKKLALRYKAIVFQCDPDCAHVALGDPHDLLTRDAIQKHLKKPIKAYFMTTQVFLYSLDTYYQEKTNNNDADAEVLDFLNHLIAESLKVRASDIHFQTHQHFGMIRFRCDGLLSDYQRVPLSLWTRIIARLKVQSELDIAETRKPQFGRFQYPFAGREIDCRMSIHPIIHGENIVIRLLDKSLAVQSLAELGFNPDQHQYLKQLSSEPQGMIIFTGPTGSGKTTSLYALLLEMDLLKRNITTLENPVEYNIAGIQQTEINQHISFAEGVRSILRQDPDVILIGEIRDEETAKMAIRASMTGHLVLSTLHTVDTFGVPGRLKDLGISLDLLVSNLLCVISQRLVRKLCPKCKTKDNSNTYYRAVGCSACEGTGYKGRLCINEFLPMTDSMKALIEKNVSIQDIKKQAPHFFSIDAQQKLSEGLTTYEEVERVLGYFSFKTD